MPKIIKQGAIATSIIVLLLVSWMQKTKFHWNVSFDTSFLPVLYSTTNLITAILLIFAFIAIKKKNITQHRQLMTAALVLSAFFLISYVLYHFTNEAMKYQGEGIMRFLYFFLLITHILTAIISFPFILFTFLYGYFNEIEKHRRIAKFIFILWLYVVLSGPLCYFFLLSS